ncbi:hypothetical protein SAMN04488118_103192 [Epibacterium ulvae]|uniref:Uncharacterized protein n=1 Tax=Epibacterium ulvae TaxID=1156985 RepID=A0A1G5Q9E8_9RHOB|nr:hypothetical protein [Epibacterium ulvae]SCZ58001.1 hypothetical protein SAMN04488118_103192 [Epibacterium ulvae]
MKVSPKNVMGLALLTAATARTNPPTMPQLSKPDLSAQNHTNSFNTQKSIFAETSNSQQAEFMNKFSIPLDIASIETPVDLENLTQKVVDRVGVPATTDASQFVSREDLGLSEGARLHIDIGGEGFHEAGGVTSGFTTALNLNAQAYDSQNPDIAIPNLVQVSSWSEDPPYPFRDETVDHFTMQGAPLTDHNVNEIARTLREGGTVELWIDHGDFDANLEALAKELGSTPRWSDDPESGVVNEFEGSFPTPKVVLQKTTQPENDEL